MRYWLMKTEPDVFSFDDLLAKPNRVEGWDGVRNYQARNFMRDDFKCGDKVFIYHSRTTEPSIVGVAEVVKEAYPDLSALDPEAKYFDEKSFKKGQSSWVKVDVKGLYWLKKPVSLQRLKQTPELSEMLVVKKGQRLSIQPVTKDEWEKVLHLGGGVKNS